MPITSCLSRGRKATACLIALLALTSCHENRIERLRILMDWFPQAEQGGFWEAAAADHVGLPLTILPGGPRVQTIPQVAAGVAEFGVAPADDVMIACMHGAPIRAIAAPIDHLGYTLIYHPDPRVRQITDLNGRTFAVNLGIAYWEWLKVAKGLRPGREIPVSGDLSLFKRDAGLVQQGIATSLPFRLEESGVPWAQIKASDLGYRPYWVLFTTDDMLANHHSLVVATTARILDGLRGYLAAPKAINAKLLAANGQLSPTILAKSFAAIRDELTPPDRDQAGCMTKARWLELARQLAGTGQLDPSFDPTKAFDLNVVKGCK